MSAFGAVATAGEMIVGQPTATGKSITPAAAKGAVFQNLFPGAPDALHANHASAIARSPDGRLVAILTTGFNRHYDQAGAQIDAQSNEYVFLFSITGAKPRQIQVLKVPNTFLGLAWAPSSSALYVSGGKDDLVREFRRGTSRFIPGRTFRLHHHGINGDLSASDPKWGPWPMAAQLAVSPDGRRLLVSNMLNDSVSLIDLVGGRVVAERDLRPGKIDPKDRGKPGGTYPGAVAWVSNDRAYVASERDRELVAIKIKATKVIVAGRVSTAGQPVALITNRARSRIYVAEDNVDRVAVIDARRGNLIEDDSILAPESVYINSQKLGGANPDGLALTPDERTLLVANGGQNSVAFVALSAKARDSAGGGGPDPTSIVVGLVPTGWYPTGVATSRDGRQLFVINGKSPPGPNADWCTTPKGGDCFGGAPPKFPWGLTRAADGELYVVASNGYAFQATKDDTILQRQRAGFLTMPLPDADELAPLTRQVAHNNGFDRPEKIAEDERLFAFLRGRIKHVIYIIKENRSYDQILGDLNVGNGDPRLALFPEPITPNHHSIARDFVTLDNFLVSGEGSWTGMQWSTAARTSVFAERNDFVNLADRGGDEAIFGKNRGLDTALPTNAQRREISPTAPLDPDVLAGSRDVAEIDGPNGLKGEGYIWDAALRAGLTVRNYGLVTRDGRPRDHPIRRPSDLKRRIADASIPSLIPFTSPYFYGVNFILPDYWRVQEWKREFAEFSSKGDLPNLSLVWLAGDHFGDYNLAFDGVNTPSRQIADNDYALGQVVEAVANSPFKDNTVIISIEDDTWDGVDHVDAFRSVMLITGPYIKQHAVVSKRYSTVNVVKTITELLGTGPVSINDALAEPMSDLFDMSQKDWSYQAIVPDILYETQLPLPPRQSVRAAACPAPARHDATYWARAMRMQDYSHADAGEFGAGNKALWQGLMGDRPYPEAREGQDFRQGRDALLARWRAEQAEPCVHF